MHGRMNCMVIIFRVGASCLNTLGHMVDDRRFCIKKKSAQSGDGTAEAGKRTLALRFWTEVHGNNHIVPSSAVSCTLPHFQFYVFNHKPNRLK